MTRIFVNREKELTLLNDIYKDNKFRLIIIYGRRRVGKTTLIKKSLENKNSIYFLCSKRKIEYNINKFSKKICEFLKIPNITFNSFIDAFKLLSKQENIIVVIDEFGYLVEKDEGILSDFQEIVDEILKNTKIKLILCGSTISMIETRILGYKSPLYGRADLQMKIKPLNFEDIFKWFKNLNFINAVKLYGVTYNVPKYLEFFKGENIEEEIIKNFFNDSSFLYNDVINILSEELRDYTTYFQVLEALALGYNRATEIANYTYLQTKDIYFYLKVLSNLDIVERIVPILSSKKEKRGIYKIKDFYFNFWFKFISPFQSEIESYSIDVAIENFKRNFNSYLGHVFENVISDLIKRRKIDIINFTKIGKWWWKDKEIDIVALNEHTKEALFCECKWKENVDAERICKDLIENKIPYFNWYNDQRKEYIAIFAKSFKEKINEFEGRKVYCFDLKDLEKYIKSNNNY